MSCRVDSQPKTIWRRILTRDYILFKEDMNDFDLQAAIAVLEAQLQARGFELCCDSVKDLKYFHFLLMTIVAVEKDRLMMPCSL